MSAFDSLKTYKPVLLFIAKFAGIYALLSWIYWQYLSFYPAQTDPLSIAVGKIAGKVFQFLGIHAYTEPIAGEHGLKLIINGAYVARIVEGCTAVSVIIMFAAFIFAFGQSWQRNWRFALLGSLALFVFNIFRIVFLGYLLYRFPAYEEMAHRIVFPALIYGFLVLLWIIFVKKYSEDEKPA